MPAIAPPLAIPPEDLRTLGQWSRSGSIRAALAERARILLLAAQPVQATLGVALPPQDDGRVLAPDRHLVAAALRRGWPGRAGRSAPLGPAADRPPRPSRRDPGHHPVAAPRAPRGHPLVIAAAGRPAGL